MGRFWWSGNLDKRSMHWLAWDKLAVPKSEGGMGFSSPTDKISS
jgi:hypothetical protein